MEKNLVLHSLATSERVQPARAAIYVSDQPRAAIYARFSSDMQRTTSIEDQTRNCKEGAKTNGFVVVQDYIRADIAKSGASLAGRTDLDSLIADAKKRPRPFDCILIDDTSRLGRNLSDVLRISDILRHNGVFLYFVTQKLDSRDPSFRQALIVNGMMDEQYLVGLADLVHHSAEAGIFTRFLQGGHRI